MQTLRSFAMGGLVLLLTVVACAEGAEGRGVDGNRLLRVCQESIRSAEGSMVYSESELESRLQGLGCPYYILGVIDMHASSVEGTRISPLFCTPVPMEAGQAVRLVVRYLQAHSEHLHWRGSAVVVAAMHEAFPCAPPTATPQR